MSRLLFRIYKLPLVGDLLCYIGSVFLRLIIPPVAWLSGGQGLRFGTSVIWIPRNKEQAILDGIECLRSHDSEMFSRLTKKQRLIIAYASNMKTASNGGRIYCLQERYIELGPEGIAAFIVASLLFSEASPSENQCRLNDRELAAVKAVPSKVLEWMCQHSFHPGLINSYRKVVTKWEESERFK